MQTLLNTWSIRPGTDCKVDPSYFIWAAQGLATSCKSRRLRDSLSAQDAGLLKSVEVPEHIAPVSQASVYRIP